MPKLTIALSFIMMLLKMHGGLVSCWVFLLVWLVVVGVGWFGWLLPGSSHSEGVCVCVCARACVCTCAWGLGVWLVAGVGWLNSEVGWRLVEY